MIKILFSSPVSLGSGLEGEGLKLVPNTLGNPSALPKPESFI